ncbi:M3 family metallopeptidase [Escherichia coli]
MPRFPAPTRRVIFVEFPSQINEHWATHPQVFARYAWHYQSGQQCLMNCNSKCVMPAVQQRV